MKCESSNIEEMNYDPILKELEVTFKHGGQYRYFGVRSDEWNDLVERNVPNGHIGKYFCAEIKPKHTFQKVNKP